MHFSLGIVDVPGFGVDAPVSFPTAMSVIVSFDVMETSTSFVLSNSITSSPFLRSLVRRPDAGGTTIDNVRLGSTAAYRAIATLVMEH
jgi:hypothetical protein